MPFPAAVASQPAVTCHALQTPSFSRQPFCPDAPVVAPPPSFDISTRGAPHLHLDQCTVSWPVCSRLVSGCRPTAGAIGSLALLQLAGRRQTSISCQCVSQSVHCTDGGNSNVLHWTYCDLRLVYNRVSLFGCSIVLAVGLVVVIAEVIGL